MTKVYSSGKKEIDLNTLFTYGFLFAISAFMVWLTVTSRTTQIEGKGEWDLIDMVFVQLFFTPITLVLCIIDFFAIPRFVNTYLHATLKPYIYAVLVTIILIFVVYPIYAFQQIEAL